MSDWTQTLLALLIVAACVAGVARSVIRTLRATEGCGSSCGHCTPAKSTPAQSPEGSAGEPPPQFIPVEFVVRSARRKKG